MDRDRSRGPQQSIPSLRGKVDPAVEDAIIKLHQRLLRAELENERLRQINPLPRAEFDGLVANPAPIRNQLQATGRTPLSIQGLSGQAAQPQIPSVPLLSTAPSPQISQPYQLANINGVAHWYDATVEPGIWRSFGSDTPTPAPICVTSPTYVPPPEPAAFDPGNNLPMCSPQPLPPGPRGWKGDFAGIRIPGSPYSTNGNFFTAFYTQYNAGDRGSFIATYQARRYTHVPISIASGSYAPRDGGTPYPAFDVHTTTAADFRPYLQELIAAGLVPVVFVWPDNLGLDDTTDLATAQGILIPWLAPVIADAATWALFTVVCVGWEINGWMSPEVITWACQYLRTNLPAGALLYVHFTPGHNAGEEPTGGWWAGMQGILTGILYQDGNRDGQSLRGGLQELTYRFLFGFHGWPTDSGFGHPFDTIAFEYDAFWQVSANAPESEGIAIGNIGVLANAPMQGFGNGCSLY
jgi:hypothetical protein